jgi:hypothetical protein
MAILYLSMTDRAKLGRCYFLDSSIADRNKIRTRCLPDPRAAGCAAVTQTRPEGGLLVRIVMLAKLMPGKLFSPTALGRYYHKNRRGMGFEPQLASELGPQPVQHCQPGRLFRVGPSAKNDKNDVRSRCRATTKPVSIRAVWSRFSNEDPTPTGCSLNRWRAGLQFFRNFNGEALASQEFGDFEVVVSLLKPARIITLDRQFPSKRERHQHEQQEEGEEPPKRGRRAHVSHLAR